MVERRGQGYHSKKKGDIQRAVPVPAVVTALGRSITLDLSTGAGCEISLYPGLRDSLNRQSRLIQ